MAKLTIEPMSRRNERGFTLIELMITIIVLAILTAAALPSFRSFIVNQRIKTASFDLMALLTFTRSEAIKRNANVTLGSDGAVFNQGANFLVTVTTPAVTTLKTQAMASGMQIDCVNMTTRTYGVCPAGGITYAANGRLTTASGQAFPSGAPALELHPINTAEIPDMYWRCITVDLSGRPNAKKGRC